MRRLAVKTLALFCGFAFLSLLLGSPVSASTREEEYSGQFISRSNETFILMPGEVRDFTISFKNRGLKAWKRNGEQFVSVYTREPNYHKSVFSDSSWISVSHPVLISEKSVASGSVGIFQFKIRAPKKLGTYTDTFQIAAEDRAWVAGTKFIITVVVKKESGDVVRTNAPAVPSPARAKKEAMLLLKSAASITVAGGVKVPIRVAFKNSGGQSWITRAILSRDLRMASLGDGADGATSRGTTDVSSPLVRQTSGMISPGQVEFLDFFYTAPKTAGTYTADFQLLVDEEPIAGGDFSIPVTVTITEDAPTPSDANAPTAVLAPLNPSAFAAGPGVVDIIPEPLIRVGLFKTDAAVPVLTQGSYRILDGNGFPVLDIPSGAAVTLTYDAAAKKYSAAFNGQTVTDPAPLVLQPDDIINVAALTNREDRPSWNKSVNYNRFRGQIYLQWSEKNQKLWVVNSLPMEVYLKGLIEASDSSPPEYQKALMTAARTYAYYTMVQTRKHADRQFDVDAAWDQVYKGYVAESHRPKIAASLDATRGMMVAYNGEVVVTPYFARSDGKTRLWSTVWGGKDKLWIQVVTTNYDAGKTKLGHGVGMSARDAAYRADTEGLSYDALLKYYYPGTELKKVYE
ncbi:MAG: SpoIID protein [Candidatus Magasanikbacteria bacterium]|nr:SpoIID protein [Candidatus Magasanikbacteria bacterium]